VRALPASVQVGPYRFTVITDGQSIAKMRRDSDSACRIGETDIATQTITVDGTLAADVLAETLLHEVMHAIWRTVGRDSWTEDSAEAKVLEFAPTLLDTLRRNPDLVAFLLSL
jgi:hypothetical protein